MKDERERGGEGPSSDGADEIDALIEAAMSAPGWVMPLDEAVPESDGEWPSILFDENEEKSDVDEPEATLSQNAVPMVEDFSLAVLPFTTDSTTGGSRVHLDMADSLTTKLGAAGLRIIRPTSTSLKFNIQDEPSIAGLSMGVKYVIDGNVKQTESGLRVETRFLSVLDRKPLWETTHTGRSHDLIGVETSMTEEVALTLQPLMTAERRARLRKHPTESTDAYLKFKQGRHRFNQFSDEGLRTAVELFEEAIKHDPAFADAYACAGETLLWLVLLGLGSLDESPIEMLLHSRDYVSQAIRLNPMLANAHNTQAFLDLCLDYDWEKATLGFLRALELDGNCAFAHLGLALIFTSRKMFTEALAEIEYSLVIDPKSLICKFFKGLINFQARNWHGSLDEFSEAFKLHQALSERLRGTSEAIPPDTIHYGQALAYVGLGFLEAARKDASKAAKYSHGHRLKLALLAYIYILLGRGKENAFWVIRDITEVERENYIPFHIALIHAALCEKEPQNREQHAAEAFRYLRLAIEKRDYWMLWVAVDPRLDVLRSDRARFDSLFYEVRLPPPGII
jgi:serine/threonine-protein kinase